MASAVFRLPSKAPYGYVEVTLSDEELQNPSEWRTALLEEILADLNQVLPVAVGAVPQDAAPAAVPAESNGAQTTCVHGNRKRVQGGPANNQWTAWFCPLDDKSAQCKAEFEKKGRR